MKKKKEKSLKRKRKIVVDSRTARLRMLFIFCGILFVPALYLSYCISGLYLQEFDILHLQEQIFWCLSHPIDCYNDRTAGMLGLGALLWFLASFTAYNRLNNNLMHGNEYGSAKWGDVHAFNEKYAAEETDVGKLSSQNKVLSENVRFRYNSDTLRNNNILVVGGSGAGKTSFFLTPNLLSLHDCNIYTDPKGSLVEELGVWLSAQEKTEVYVLNMCEMEKSMYFNPFLYLRKRSDITKLVTNLIQNTSTPNIKNSNQDPFWERAERMFLESLFLYVWMECPMGNYNPQTGKADLLEKNWKTIMYLLDEAQFADGGKAPKLDERMSRLEQRKPGHPAVKAYRRYRGGPDETIRSVIMTVNARMQPFDNEDLLKIFSQNDIPLDAFGGGRDGDRVTRSNLFIVIPDDDDTFNFVPGMIYTLLFQELYRQARFFGGKLPMDVGVWLDEMANIKMPNNFEKVLATCRSRGVYCVPILQSLAQLKTLFADGAWEGVVGNCDTFLYLGGNEPSTYEYVSKLLGKWTIDKRTSGESKGTSGSYSENYDVLGRELMLEYEIRLLPDDECILFVRGENPIRDKKWFPWEHEEYKTARSYGDYRMENRVRERQEEKEECQFVNECSLKYLKMQAKTGENVGLYEMNVYDFMMMDLNAMMEKKHEQSMGNDLVVNPRMIQSSIEIEKKREEEEKRRLFALGYFNMSLLDIYSSDLLGDVRRNAIKEMIGKNVGDEEIKSIIRPDLTELEVMERKRAWLEMRE